jgi:hypothetical protein
MRRLLTFTLALVMGLFVLAVPAAVAGGPTSVLIANYENGRSAAALNGSAAYTELQSILGAESPPAGTSTPAGVRESEAAVRLVWLIHDVSPWRIDNVHVVGQDVWVETYVNTSGSDPYAGSPTWHQPARGADLVASLTSLGVLGAGAPGAQGSTSAQEAAASGSSSEAVTESSAAGASWLLATGCAAGGALLGLLLGTVLARRGPWLHHVSRRAEATV